MTTWKWGYWNREKNSSIYIFESAAGQWCSYGPHFSDVDYGYRSGTENFPDIISAGRQDDLENPKVCVSEEHMKFIADACNEKREREAAQAVKVDAEKASIVDPMLDVMNAISPPSEWAYGHDAEGNIVGRKTDRTKELPVAYAFDPSKRAIKLPHGCKYTNLGGDAMIASQSPDVRDIANEQATPPVQLKSGDKCSFEGCDKTAVMVASGRQYDTDEGRHPKPSVYCEVHGHQVSNEGEPEYTNSCPNCGCLHGVN